MTKTKELSEIQSIFWDFISGRHPGDEGKEAAPLFRSIIQLFKNPDLAAQTIEADHEAKCSRETTLTDFLLSWLIDQVTQQGKTKNPPDRRGQPRRALLSVIGHDQDSLIALPKDSRGSADAAE